MQRNRLRAIIIPQGCVVLPAIHEGLPVSDDVRVPEPLEEGDLVKGLLLLLLIHLRDIDDLGMIRAGDGEGERRRGLS